MLGPWLTIRPTKALDEAMTARTGAIHPRKRVCDDIEFVAMLPADGTNFANVEAESLDATRCRVGSVADCRGLEQGRQRLLPDGYARSSSTPYGLLYVRGAGLEEVRVRETGTVGEEQLAGLRQAEDEGFVGKGLEPFPAHPSRQKRTSRRTSSSGGVVCRSSSEPAKVPSRRSLKNHSKVLSGAMSMSR